MRSSRLQTIATCDITGISLIIIRLNLTKVVIGSHLQLLHNDGSSLVLPQNVLVAAQNDEHFDCKDVCIIYVYIFITA